MTPMKKPSFALLPMSYTNVVMKNKNSKINYKTPCQFGR
jgi:hypothetical protein